MLTVIKMIEATIVTRESKVFQGFIARPLFMS